MSANDSSDDFFDAPETPGRRSKWEQWGYFYFKDGLQKANVDFVEPNKEESSIIRVSGRPTFDANGNVTGIMPFLRPRPSRNLSDPAEKLFAPTVCYEVRVVRYVGPRPEMDDDGRREGPPQLHFIDEWSPAVRRQYAAEGRQLPPTCCDLLLAKAPSVVARNSKYGKYFKSDDDFNSCLRRPTKIWFLNGLCMNHGKVECSAENPIAVIHLLTWTGYKSMMDLVLEENKAYTYPEGANHAKIGTREELARRFVCPDLTNPEFAPALVFTQHKQKRRSSKSKGESGNVEGNKYVATLSNDLYPFSVEDQVRMWTAPEDLFYYPTPEEAFNLMLNHAGEEDWLDFLLLLAKGTDLEQPESVRGAELEHDAVNSRQFTPPARAASRTEDVGEDGADDVASDYEYEAAPPPARSAAGGAPNVAAPLGLGSDFGKRQPGEVQATRAERTTTDDIPPHPSMPLPDHKTVFGNVAAPLGAPSDTPESVEERTRQARARLEQMKNKG